MNNKDKFLMFLSLICLPFGELAAEQIGNMEVFPINQEIQQNVKITGRVIDAGWRSDYRSFHCGKRDY